MIKVVRVTAIWCMSCLVMRNRYDKLFKKYGIDDVLDLDFDEDDVSQYRIGKVLPAIIIYKDGVELIRLNGEKSKKEIKQLIEEIL